MSDPHRGYWLFQGEDMNNNLIPIEGCRGCEGMAGRLGCTIHSPNVYIADPPKPFAQLFLRCPHCGKDMQLDAYALESLPDGGKK